MKILYIIDQTNLFGSELHVYDIIKRLSPKNEIKLLAFKKGELIELINKSNLNIEIEVIELSWFSALLGAKKILNVIKSFSPDIIHSHQPKAVFYGSIYSKFAGRKHISTIHSIPYVSASIHEGIKRKIVLLFHTCVQFTAEYFSSKSIFIANYNKEKYSFFKKKSVVIHNWVSDRLDQADSNSAVNQHTHPPVRFLSVGSITRVKGFVELVKLFSKAKTLINFELLIAGSGDADLEIWIKKFIADNDLEDRIFLLGYQSNLIPLYNAADYFILLPEKETFGLVFIEAMKFGLPVICSDIMQLREIVPKENIFMKNNTFFNQQQLDAINSIDYRTTTGQINKIATQKLFNIDNQINKVYQLYISLTN